MCPPFHLFVKVEMPFRVAEVTHVLYPLLALVKNAVFFYNGNKLGEVAHVMMVIVYERRGRLQRAMAVGSSV